jgi:dephospho-CoA kinase
MKKSAPRAKPARPAGPIIGLTGTYCAGKNHVARLFEDRGIPVLDVDTLGYRVLETEREAIAARFGPAVLGPGGAVDRGRLGERVFGKPAELAALEEIVHPAVNRLTDEWIAARGGRPCVINAALLHRSSAFERLSCLILVKAPVLTRLLRARKRDRLSWGQILKRFKSQRKFIPQYFKKKSDTYMVYNRGYTPLGSRLWRRILERRIALILSRIGMA